MPPNKKIQETIIFSVGGSLIVPNGGIDATFLKHFNDFIRKHIQKGRRFFIVVGGGRIARHYRDAGKEVIGKITETDLDWLGIHATRFNAHLLRTIFRDIAHPRIISNYEKKLTDWKEPVVIGSGWKPGHSTDYDAVILARDYKSGVIINLSNIDWVYDRDPKKFKDARPIKKATWEEFESVVGSEWSPGKNAPFDPVASRLARDLGLTVIIANGTDFKNLDNILNGEEFKGTVVTPFKIDASFYDREYFKGRKNGQTTSVRQSLLGRLTQYLSNFYRALWIKLFINPKSCLDVGCGTGGLVGMLRGLGIDAHGIEISRYALDAARADIKPFLKQGDIVKIPHKDESFDCVVTVDVLQHLERSKLKRAIAETARVSRRFVVHKVYTTENHWITYFCPKDFSQLSVLSLEYWLNLLKYVENVSVARNIFKLPSFFETLLVLRKKKA